MPDPAIPPHSASQPRRVIAEAAVMENVSLCREHFRLSVLADPFPQAAPGQFVHISPPRPGNLHYATFDWRPEGTPDLQRWSQSSAAPFLRRAFSIAGFERQGDGVRIEVIYRVVGRGTEWMASLKPKDKLSALGPLGNRFPIVDTKRVAWLIAGGVGLPPMLWLADTLNRAGREPTAFCGAQSKDLLPLTVDPQTPPSPTAKEATFSATEFSRSNVAIVISTDDGTIGFHGHVGNAVSAFHNANRVDHDDLVIYACGPEAMLQFVADFCNTRKIECYLCMERAMACGMGTCQSCVVPIRDTTDPDGWCYQLCCTDGPIFEAGSIIWEK
jgi:dihydroorotate dehydrogenase electron transfer subunit